jgi:solute carrier family 13 (sodium-dependent dicarboxylate transporter), member 2/3/5
MIELRRTKTIGRHARADGLLQARAVSTARLVALLLGPLAALLPLVLPTPPGLGVEAWRLVGLAGWMVIWWLTEVVPLPVTALLPLPFMPLLGIAAEKEVAADYANPLIFLFLGGFLIAAALQRWGLHRRIALTIVRRVGASPARMIGGMLAATAFLSMWISNTATAAVMFPVGLSLVECLRAMNPDAPRQRNFGIALMLSIAFGASIGGAGTLIGTPPNALLASFVSSTYGYTLDMGRWLWIGMPFVLLMLPLAWLWLTRVAFPVEGLSFEGVCDVVQDELDRLGPMTLPERVVLFVFILTAASWIFRSSLVTLLNVDFSDSTIALIAALVLFTVPLSLEKGEFVLDWKAAESVPWGVLLLFGGGLALAAAFESTGLAAAIGQAVGTLDGINIWVIIALVTAVVIVLGELASNTATAATLLPIMGAAALGLGVHPLLLAVPVALAASANFALPVATPPNTIVFAYKEMRVSDMLRAGVVLDILSLLIILLLLRLLVGPVLGLG